MRLSHGRFIMKFILELFSPIGLTRLIYITLIICSAAVTAYFGVVMGGSFVLVPTFDVLLWTVPNITMGFFTAAGFFAISVASAVFAYHAGHMRSLRQPEWRFVAQFAMFLLACDIFTNYMSWSTIRTGKAVLSQNSNIVAANTQQRLAALNKTEADLSNVIRAPGAWVATADAEKALAATLAARDREGARVRCGRKCEELDAKARDLRLEISKSKTREGAIAERKKIRAQIAKIRAETEVKQVVIDPTLAQNAELASTFAGMKPSDSAKFYAAKVIGIVGAIMFSLGASACGLLLGLLTGQTLAHSSQSAPQPRVDSRPKFISAAPEFEPQPLYAEPAPSTTKTSTVINYSGGARPDPQSIENLIATLERDFGLKPNQT